MTAAAAAVAVAAAGTATAGTAVSPTRYERTLRNCARALSDFAGCTEPGAFWDEERFREWAREHRAESTKQAGRFVARLLRDKVANYDELGREDLLRWHKILAKKGWVAPAWPKEWGGTDWNVVQRYIFEEE